MKDILTETQLASVALSLIGQKTTLSDCEYKYIKRHSILPSRTTNKKQIKDAILQGQDPLGNAFMGIRAPEKRRTNGATYTPAPIIQSMLEWASANGTPGRIVDPGAGSGRFLIEAAKVFPAAQIVAVEIDPLALLILRANIAAHGITGRTTIVSEDFRAITLPEYNGTTLFIGNPPYVRHHDIGENWKNWFAETAIRFGVKASKLAGLHIHFFLKTMELAKQGDYGTFITSAEWLDVNYGSSLRYLLADGLGGVALHVLDPKAMPFEDAITTGAITCFRRGERPDTLRVRTVESTSSLGDLSTGIAVPWEQVEQENRWSIIVRPGPKVPAGYIQLGDICRVHRGQVTGGNSTWIEGLHTRELPTRFMIPTVTKAKDIIDAGMILGNALRLKRVVDLPVELDELDREERRIVERFIAFAKSCKANESYTAQHRKAWWSVGLKDPAPIISTYMGRRPPAFTLNKCHARHINVAHGLYPVEKISEKILSQLVAWLQNNVRVDGGRTYAGGLTKFEPKELERIPIPKLEHLANERLPASVDQGTARCGSR